MNAKPRRAVARRPTRGAHDTAPSDRGSSARVDLDAIVVDASTNPRQRLRNVDELAESIHTYGLLQPVVVRQIPEDDAHYRLVAGHRRLAALRLLAERYPREDWRKVQVVIRSETEGDAYLLTLVENLQRDDLSPREESEGLARLLRERKWSTRQVAAAIGRSQPYVSRRLRVYEDPALRGLVLSQHLPVSIAEELLGAEASKRAELARQAAAQHWDQKRTRAEVRGHTAAFHPQLREWVGAILDLIANASLSTGEKQLLCELATQIRAVATC